MKSVAIIGGGIAGLVTGYRLMNSGLEITLFEASRRTGGVIRSERSGGYLVEYGPNTIQTKTDLIDKLIADLGIRDQQLFAADEARNRYVVRNGKPVPVPASPPAFLKTRLFSSRAKLRLLREPFVQPVDEQVEESVADFVRRRLGDEFLDYAINPFVAGVYAGDPERLSLRHAFPRMFELERQYGSLIKGMIRLSRERKKATSPMPAGRMMSFKEGLQTLPDALARNLGERIRLESRITGIRKDNDRWKLSLENAESDQSFDAVLYAAPLYTLPSVNFNAGVEIEAFSKVHYPAVSVLALGFPRENVQHPLDGFGVLVPAVESQFSILGSLFSSTLFPGRAPENHVLLTTFIGGVRHEELASSAWGTLKDTVSNDLRDLLGIRGMPDFTQHVYWERAIPQYHVGYGKIKELLDTIEKRNPGFYLTGNFRNGISVSDTVTYASDTAERMATWLHEA